MRLKRIALFICFALLINISYFPVEAAQNKEIEDSFSVSQLGEQYDILVWAAPGEEVGIEIINPGAAFPPSSDSKEDILSSFAYLSEETADKDGEAKFTFTAKKTTGTFTVNYSDNVEKAVITRHCEKPFFALTWPSVDTVYDSVINVPYISIGNELSGEAMNAKAEAVIEKLKGQPDGKKAMFFGFESFRNMLISDTRNHVWWDSGADSIRSYLTSLFKEYKELGGELDYIYMDLETYLNAGKLGTDSEVYQSIEADSAYETDIRPLLEERGYDFCTDSDEFELYDLTQPESEKYQKARLIWDAVMLNRVSDYLTYAVYEPAKEYFPDVCVSDYGKADMKAWYKNVSFSGDKTYEGGHLNKTGTHSNVYIYGDQLSGILENPPEDFNRVYYEGTPFNAMLYDQNRYRAAYLSDEDKKLQPWIAYYDYSNPGVGTSTANSPYYTESIYHAAMLNPESFLFYIPFYVPGKENDENYNSQEAYDKCLEREKVLSDILEELSYIVGTADRQPIMVDNPSWNSRYLLSGMYSGGRNIWRITPDISVTDMTLEKFKTADETPTFSIAGQTVTFPEGKIIDTPFENNNVGYWVETPSDVFPQIAYDADTPRLNPSVSLDFEEYTDLPNTVVYDKWGFKNIKPDLGTLNVVSENETDNQILSVTADNSKWRYLNFIERLKVLGREQKKQTWEIRFKLPSVSKTGATLSLFEYSGMPNSSVTDSGVTVKGNQIYCGEDAVLSDNNLLKADKWYRLKRVMDFSDNSKDRYDVYVYDENNNLIGTKENTETQSCGFPVKEIQFRSTDYDYMSSIYFDDFLVYPSGLDLKLETYNASTGMLLSEISGADGTVARLSYNNATGENVEYMLLQAIYENQRLISLHPLSKGIMQAGQDDVIVCDVVPISNGSTKTSYFLWNSYDKLRPLIPTIVLEESE